VRSSVWTTSSAPGSPRSNAAKLLTTAAVLAGAVVLAAVPAGAREPFINGEAMASADTFTLNIRQGNADIGFTYGRSAAGYRDRTADAQAQALDLGVLPTLFAVEQCDGSAPPMNPDTLPAVTRTDSTAADSTVSRRVEAFVPGQYGGPRGASAGFQDAIASAQPYSRGTTESVDTDVFLIALDGGRTEVTAELRGRVREARAITRADELRVFGGLFTFINPTWEATARSGDLETTEGSFTFDSATVLGLPRTNEEALKDFGEFERGLEQLLRPFGVQLDLPAVETEDGRVRVTPMAFRVVDPPFGSQVIAPFLGSMQSMREARSRELIEQDCTNALAITLLDVILGVAAGSGAIEVLAGGVDVFTADTDFSAPPLEPFPALAPIEVAPAVELPPMDLDLVAVPEPEPAAELAISEPEPEPETDRRPERTRRAVVPAASTRFEDTDAGRAAVAVGIAGMVGALGLTAGERIRSRRSVRSKA
jgi:hypothetical protein